MKRKTRNVLVIPDLHIPYEHPRALSFCLKVKKKYNCDTVISLGDIFESAGWSYHQKDPDGATSGQEVDAGKKKVKPWVRAFPELKICIGNHELRMNKKMTEAGLPKSFIKTFNEAWGLPRTWKWDFSHELNGVRYMHGVKFNKYSFAINPDAYLQPVVSAHTHAHAGLYYKATDNKFIWGMNCGCLIDTKSAAFAYGRDYATRPIVGVGVVLNNGTFPIFIPMEL